MNRLLCSTGCIVGMPNGRNHNIIPTYAPKIRCDGFEFMIYSTWYDKLNIILRDLKLSGLYFPAVHCDKHIGEMLVSDEEKAYELFEINCHAAAYLGAQKLVVHIWNGTISDSHMDVCIGAYPRLKSTADKYGVLLTIENVVCNVHSPLKNLKALRDRYPRVAFTIDTKMAAFHNELDDIFDGSSAWLWKENHVRHIHINDYAGSYMDWGNLRTPHIGDGNVNFDSFFSGLSKWGYNGDFTVEATSFMPNGIIDVEKLNSSLDTVRAYIHSM